MSLIFSNSLRSSPARRLATSGSACFNVNWVILPPSARRAKPVRPDIIPDVGAAAPSGRDYWVCRTERSFMGTFGDWADLVHGPAADWGHLNCGCHPNCGVGMAVMIDKETRERAPV